MPHKDSLHADSTPVPGWRILGELRLPAGASPDDALRLWLSQLLEPLGLHADFLCRILRSAQEAAGRALHAETLNKTDHIHLIVFAPPDHRSHAGQTWGFFQIEKMNDAPSGERDDHSIELYLYLEG